MDQCVEGDAGGILGLREFIAEHEEAVASDLFDRGLEISDIGDTVSWFAFRCWLKHLLPTSAVVRVRQQRAAEAAIPEDMRTVGKDGLPFDDMYDWLGWTEKAVSDEH